MTVTVNYVISNVSNFTEVAGYEPDDTTIAFPTIVGNADFEFTVTFSITGDEVPVTLISVECTSSPPFVDADTLSFSSIRLSRNREVDVFPGERFDFVRYGYNQEGDDMLVAEPDDYPEFPENPNDTSADANTPVANTEFDFDIDEDDLVDLNTSIFPTGTEDAGVFETFSQARATESDLDSSVYAWTVPPVQIITDTFTFLITYMEDSMIVQETISKTYSQEYHWSWVPGLETLDEVVGRSRF
jgi:hypothetical protein